MRISDWSSDVCSSDLAGLARLDVERLDDRQAALAVEFRQDRRDRGAVHLAVDLLREAARLGRERHAAADEDRGRQRAMTRTAALLLLRLLGGAADFRARLLRLGAGTARVAVGNDNLVDQVLAEFAAEHGVGNRQLLFAISDGKFHRRLSLFLARRTDDHVAARRASPAALARAQAPLGAAPDPIEPLPALAPA